MKLTKEEAIRKHREMWRWIAEETEKQKRIVLELEYFKAMGIEADSYCCECGVSCNECPILWGGENDHCLAGDGPYMAWLLATNHGCNWQLAAELARKIAELPERKVNKDYE